MSSDTEKEVATRPETSPAPTAAMPVKDRLASLVKTSVFKVRLRIRELIDAVTRRRPASISYRFLAHQIAGEFAGFEGTPIIVFSAVESADLGSDTALMLAHFLHEELGSRVLLVDGSFAAGGVSELFGFTAEAGLTDCLDEAGHSVNDYIKPTANPGVFVLPSGQSIHKISRPVETQVIRSILDGLDQFDFVLVQQGSITQDTRYRTFVQMADLVLLYCEEGATLVSEYEACQNLFREYEVKNVGVIMLEAGG